MFRAGKSVPLIDIADVPNLELDYDANKDVYNDLGSTLATDGQTVNQWNNQLVSTYNLIQSTSGFRPTFQTNELNGLPVVRFDGSDDLMVSATSPSSLHGNNSKTIFVVGCGQNASENTFIIHDGTSSNGKVFGHSMQAGLSQAIEQFAFDLVGVATFSAATFHVFTGLKNVNNLTLYLDGVLDAGPSSVGAASINTPAEINVGGSTFGGGNSLQCDIARILFYSRALTASEIVKINKSLLTTYGF